MTSDLAMQTFLVFLVETPIHTKPNYASKGDSTQETEREILERLYPIFQ
jgi:hypothetical protein